MKRPSPSLVISVLALFVALGGTGYAALTINGKDIRRGTVAGSKLKRDTLTGRQVKERSLGKVPRAANADRLGGRGAAAFARSSQFFHSYTRATRGAEKTILVHGPFKVTLVCVSGLGSGNVPLAGPRLDFKIARQSLNSISHPGQDFLLPAGSSFNNGSPSLGNASAHYHQMVGGYIDTANGRTMDISVRLRLNALGNNWCDAVTQATFG